MQTVWGNLFAGYEFVSIHERLYVSAESSFLCGWIREVKTSNVVVISLAPAALTCCRWWVELSHRFANFVSLTLRPGDVAL